MARVKKSNAKNKPAKISATIMPRREDILKFIQENPDLSGKRELARAFNLKGDARIELKNILRSLKDEGLIEKKNKQNIAAGGLPPVTQLTIYARDQDGDFLAHPSNWDQGKPPIISVSPRRHGEKPVIGVGDRILAKIFKNKNGGPANYSGRVIHKLEAREKTSLGVLRQLDNGEWRLEPIDRRDGEIKLDTSGPITAKAGDLVEVKVNRNNGYGLKRGQIHEVVGRIDSEKALSMIAIISHDIPHIFKAETLAAAEAAKPATMENREDWRDISFVTIDPADAKDHDDAVFAAKDDNNDNPDGHIVYVAIADVAYYINTNAPMDQEAYGRGNSVYFPDRVVPMLPERISNNLCSLREGEERPALAVKMVFDRHGNKRSHTFHRIMMKSIAKLSYQQAQAAIDGKPDEKTTPLLESVLQPLWKAYATIKEARDKRQPLDLDLPEKKILLDEQGRVKDVVIPPRLDAHRLIEECMIAANVSAAETLKAKHQKLIYRIHDQPSLAKQEMLRDFLHSLNMPLARGVDLTPAKFNMILNKVKNTPEQDLVNQVVLRTQSQAEYSCDNIGHFGLNLHNYAHFTSPIRRYADLTVHRALIKALHLGNDGLTNAEEANLEETAALISSYERRAMAAERETIDRLIAHFLADKIGAEFAARIGGTTKSGLFVNLDGLGADGFIPISTLGREYFIFDEARHALIGERSRKGYQMGDRVQVKLIEAQPIAGALRFEMLTPPQPLPFSPVSHHKSSVRQKKKFGKGRKRHP